MGGVDTVVTMPVPFVYAIHPANEVAHSQSTAGRSTTLKPGMQWLTKERRLYGVILIAFSFLVAELVVGFTNNALVLVADAFHIAGDLIGYIVSVLCIRLAEADDTRDASKRKGFSYGWQRSELLGAAFNGVFLLGLGVSVVLQSVDRFIQPSKLGNAVLVAIIGGAGIASNILMVALLVGSSETPNSDNPTEMDQLEMSEGHLHANHAHSLRLRPKERRFDLNVLGVLLHILGDAVNSLAVIISAIVYLKTGWVYADPIATLFVGCMIIGTALPLIIRTGRMLAEAAPLDIDLEGVHADVTAVEGVKGVQELHVWSLSQSKALASVHIDVASDSLTAFMALSRKVQTCLRFWGIHEITIQPIFSGLVLRPESGVTASAASSVKAGVPDAGAPSTEPLPASIVEIALR